MTNNDCWLNYLHKFDLDYLFETKQFNLAARKMPSATGDSDKTTLDVNNVTSKTSKMSRNPQDHVKSFEIAIIQYKEDPNEKSMANIDKVLQVRPSSLSVYFKHERIFGGR